MQAIHKLRLEKRKGGKTCVKHLFDIYFTSNYLQSPGSPRPKINRNPTLPGNKRNPYTLEQNHPSKSKSRSRWAPPEWNQKRKIPDGIMCPYFIIPSIWTKSSRPFTEMQPQLRVSIVFHRWLQTLITSLLMVSSTKNFKLVDMNCCYFKPSHFLFALHTPAFSPSFLPLSASSHLHWELFWGVFGNSWRAGFSFVLFLENMTSIYWNTGHC